MAFYRVQVKVDEVAIVDAVDESDAVVKVTALMAHPECEWFTLEIDKVEDDEQ